MREWLRVRRVVRLVPVFAAAVLLVALFGTREVGAPAVIGGGTGRLPVTAFVAVVLGAAFAHMFDGRDTVVEITASRAIRRYDLVLFAGSVTAVSVGCALTQSMAGGSAQRGLTSAAIVSSAAVATTCVAGEAAGTIAAVAVFLGSVTYSPHLTGATWIRLLQPEADLTVAWSVAAALVIVAGALTLRGQSLGAHQ